MNLFACLPTFALWVSPQWTRAPTGQTAGRKSKRPHKLSRSPIPCCQKATTLLGYKYTSLKPCSPGEFTSHNPPGWHNRHHLPACSRRSAAEAATTTHPLQNSILAFFTQFCGPLVDIPRVLASSAQRRKDLAGGMSRRRALRSLNLQAQSHCQHCPIAP